MMNNDEKKKLRSITREGSKYFTLNDILENVSKTLEGAKKVDDRNELERLLVIIESRVHTALQRVPTTNRCY